MKASVYTANRKLEYLQTARMYYAAATNSICEAIRIVHSKSVKRTEDRGEEPVDIWRRYVDVSIAVIYSITAHRRGRVSIFTRRTIATQNEIKLASVSSTDRRAAINSSSQVQICPLLFDFRNQLRPINT